MHEKKDTACFLLLCSAPDRQPAPCLLRRLPCYHPKLVQWGAQVLQQLEERPFDPAGSPSAALVRDRYAIGWAAMVSLVFRRQLKLNTRERTLFLVKATQVRVVAATLQQGSKGWQAWAHRPHLAKMGHLCA